MSTVADTLRQSQLLLARYLREPENAPAPANVEPRRLKIYEELIYRNIEGFISGGFPVLRRLYQDQHWHSLVREFIRVHRCETPYFLEISQEFLRFLMESHEPRDCDPPFLIELAHYEWLELALDSSEEEIPTEAVDHLGSPMGGIPVVSPLVMASAYQYPVHRIGPDYQPTEPGAQPTFIMVYRNRDDEVCFMETNGATVQLLENLRNNTSRTGKEVLAGMVDDFGMSEERVLGFGQQVLENLAQQSIIAGIRIVI